MRKFNISHIILFLLLSVISNVLLAQEKGLILSKYYSPKDYKAGTQNWCITQDSRGVLYFGNVSGILEYDGETWRSILVPNDATVRSLAFDQNDVLFAGAYGQMGFLSPDLSGNLIYKSLNHLLDSSHKDFGEIWDINCFSDTVFFQSDKYIFRYHNNKFDYWKSKNDRFYLSHKINNSLLIQEMGMGLMEFVDDSLVLIDDGDFFADIRIHSILPYGDDLLVCTRTKGFYIYSNSGNKTEIKSFSEISSKTKSINKYFIDNIFYHGIVVTDSIYALSTVTGNILIIDKSWNIIDVINDETIGLKTSIHYLYQQKNQSLWIALGNGICQVEILSPYRFWNDDKGIHGTLSDVAKIKDNLYISTGTGVYFTNSKKTSEFELSTFNPIEGTFEQSWGFLYFQPSDSKLKSNPFKDTEISNRIRTDETLLLVSTSRGLFQIIDDKSVLISDHKAIFLSYQYKKDPDILFLGLKRGVAMLSYKDGIWENHGLKYNILDEIRSINEDSLGNLWLSAAYKGVYKISNPLYEHLGLNNIEFFDTSANLASIKSIYIHNFQDNLIFDGINNSYTYNSKTRNFEDFTFPEDTANVESQQINAIDTLSEYRIYEDALSNFYVIDDDDPYSWFGTNMGTCRYNHRSNRNLFDISPTLIRKVIASDSLIFNGTNYRKYENPENIPILDFVVDTNPIVDLRTVLEFKYNSLTFFFASPNFEEELKNKYSFYLDNFDDDWSEWTIESKKEYTNLREGDYVFKVKAINIYNIESPAAEFKFTILPPWYRSFSAFLGYSIFGVLLIILIVKLYTYRLIKEKDNLEKIVIERTQEILMQKEEILVQSEHLKDANEGIVARNEELEKQKWEITNQALKLKKANVELIKLSKVASETDNAIAIFNKEGTMEWVNDGFTRMYGYTYEQYANEKNINFLEGSFNPNIQEALKSCINDKKSVVYEFKTKTRDGKELWAQTTLTHVTDKNGETLNLIAIDSDITKIKLAERELAEQRDKLEISNATKNKFFRIIAHDLRNPISTLAGSTNLIFNAFDDFDKKQTKLFIGELNKLSHTTFNLLENLLDWSSTQMGEIKYLPKPIDLSLLTAENIELIAPKIDSKNIELSVNIDKNTFAFADENMVKTIIRNLLSNAVKFTPENGKIEISCKIKEQFLSYSVKDSGVGINKDDLKKLFRIDEHHTTSGLSNEKGSGLGLILCKEFVEKNKGAISITSEPNNGTCIEFTLKNHLS